MTPIDQQDIVKINRDTLYSRWVSMSSARSPSASRIPEMYVEGVSTRRVKKIVEEL